MKNNTGNFIHLSRKIMTWGWKTKPDMVALWVDLLCRAQWHDGHYLGAKLEPGQCVVGLSSLSSTSGLSTQRVRTCLTKLKSTGEITVKSTNQYSIVTICKWSEYQMVKDSNQQANQQAEQQTSNKRLTNEQHASNNIQEYKNIRKKEDKNYTPVPTEREPLPSQPKFDPNGKTKYKDWVYLSDEQLKRVQLYYEKHGLNVADLKEAIRELDRWFSDNPKMRAKRVDDAKALMGWPFDRAIQRRKNLDYVRS